MSTPLPDSTLHRALFRLGGWAQTLADRASGKGSAEGLTDELRDAAVAVVVARAVRPRAVSWPRLAAAVGASIVLGELASGLGEGAAVADDEGEASRALVERAAADVAAAAAYASLIYPLLPGPPLLRALAFTALDAAAAPGGGAVALLRGISPRLVFPLSDLHPAGAERHVGRALALGLALGLLYRVAGGDDDEDDEDA